VTPTRELPQNLFRKDVTAVKFRFFIHQSKQDVLAALADTG